MTIAARIREQKYSALENYLMSLPADLRQFGIEYLAANAKTLRNGARIAGVVTPSDSLMQRRYGATRVDAVRRRLNYADARNVKVVTANSKRGLLTFAYLVTLQGDAEMDRENVATVRDQLRRYARCGDFIPALSSEPEITEFGRVFRLARS